MAVSISEGRQKIIGAVTVIDTEKVDLIHSFGRVLAETVTAKEDVPAFDRSPYDGYAFCSEDVKDASKEHPVSLQVVENIPAGDVPSAPLKRGQAVRLMTGAPIPEGADAVTMYELTEFSDAEVKIFQSAKHGENIIYAGEDVKKGTVLAEPGMKIDSGLMGTLAGQNISCPLVYKQPVIGILVTGSELVPVGEEPGPGMILDTNQYTLTGAMENLGFSCKQYGIVKDTMEEIKAAILKALEECDAVLITGGAAVGDYDLTPAAMEEIGAEILFRNVKLKPGKACAYGIKDGKLICGLSGHPSSSVLNLHIVGVPGLKKLSGLKEYEHKEIELELLNGFAKGSDMDRALRGNLVLQDGKAKISFPQAQGNVMISGTIGTDCIAIIPEGSKAVEAGTKLKGFRI